MNKIDMIRLYLSDGSLPMLSKEKDYTVQEYMKLKQESIRRISEANSKK